MYIIDENKKDLRKIEEANFAELNIREVEHIEEWVIKQPEILAEGLMVISAEFSAYEKIKQRFDVLAIDSDGKLVVIELKRDKADETTDLQAIKYASYVANFSSQDVQELYRDFWNNRQEKELHPEDVGEKFRVHLEDSSSEIAIGEDGYAEFELDNKPRIILAAGDFGTEITAPVTWLNQEYGLDVMCIELQAFTYEGNLLVNNRVVLPVPEIEEYQAKRRKKQEEQESQKRGRAIHVLLEKGIIKKGDIVTFDKSQSRFELGNEYDSQREFWQAKVTGKTGQSDNICWMFNDQEYSFTSLTKSLIEKVTGNRPDSLNGYKYWTKKEDERTLSDIRQKL